MNGKMYYEDPYLKEFSAEVVEQGREENGLYYVILNQTAFYPTGGGQPCDLGTLDGIDIVDVEEVDGAIRHRTKAPITGKSIHGSIDWNRRFDHMQQHTGQHILSAAFEQLFDAATVGFHLGRETVTIDLATSELTDEMIYQVTELANRIIVENREIRAQFVSDEELSQMPLRKKPTVLENIRIVIVDQFDYSPCGGTHPYRTGEVGPIQIIGFERSRNAVRVEFICGFRAIYAFIEKQRIIRQMTQALSSNESELIIQLDKFLGERRELEKLSGELRDQLLVHEADQLAKQPSLFLDPYKVIVQSFDERSMQELQRLAKKITADNPDIIVLLISQGSKLQMVCARGTSVSIPMDAWIKSLLPLINGKGGGNKEMAQGGGINIDHPADLTHKALQWLKEAHQQWTKASKQ